MSNNKENSKSLSTNKEKVEEGWSRRDFIKVVGVATAGISLMGVSPLLAANSNDVKIEDGNLIQDLINKVR